MKTLLFLAVLARIIGSLVPFVPQVEVEITIRLDARTAELQEQAATSLQQAEQLLAQTTPDEQTLSRSTGTRLGRALFLRGLFLALGIVVLGAMTVCIGLWVVIDAARLRCRLRALRDADNRSSSPSSGPRSNNAVPAGIPQWFRPSFPG